MAVSAKFTADFTQFNAEAKKAEQSLKLVEKQSEDLGTTSSRVAGVLGSTFGQAFAGFTAANLLSSAVSTLSSLAAEAFKSAEAIVDLSNATGASIETVQRWRYVAAAAGEDVKLFADAAFKLGTTLAGGGNSVEAAVKALGLSYQTLARLAPDQQFDTIAAALSEMEAGQDRNTIAVTLFGRQASELLPAIGDNYAELSKAATVSTDEQIKALDEAVQEWNKFKTITKGVADSVFANVVLFLRDAYKQITFAPIGKDIELVADAARQAGPSIKETADAMAQADRDAKEFAKANQAIIESMAGSSGLNGAVEQAIRYYLELGVSQQTLATYYDEAPAAIAAVAAAMREEEAAAKERQGTMQKQIDATMRLIESFKGPAGLNAATAEHITEALRLKGSQSDIAVAFGVSSAAVAKLASDLEAATAKTAALTAQTNSYVLENLKARQAIETARGGGAAAATPYGTYESAIGKLREEQAGPGGGVIDFAARQEALWIQLQDDLGKVTESSNAVSAAQTTQAATVTTGTDSVHQFAASTQQVASGFLAMSGELHASIVAAQQIQALAGADKGVYAGGFSGYASSPSSRWMAAATTNSLMQPPQITINGSVLGNKDEIARVVGDAITHSYSSGGRRMPV